MAKRVLVVDFDPGTLESTVTLLKGRGFEVVAASSLEQVERALIPDAPDVALVEPALHGVDSYELCSLIHGSAAHSPSIILASHKMKGEALRFRASEVGADLFFERPINDRTLVQAIAEAVSSAGAADADAAARARSRLRAVPPAEPAPAPAAREKGAPDRGNTVELTSIGNTEFEGWLNDVFSGIEGPADVSPATPEPPAPPAASAPAPAPRAARPAPSPSPPASPAPTPAAAPTPTAAPTPAAGPAPAPASQPAAAATPPSTRSAPRPPVSAAPARPAPPAAPEPKGRPLAPANASPATATPVAVAPRPRKPAATDADFPPAARPARGPWLRIAGVAVLLALGAGGYFGWKQLGEAAAAAAATEPGTAEDRVPAAAQASLPAASDESVAEPVPGAVPGDGGAADAAEVSDAAPAQARTAPRTEPETSAEPVRLPASRSADRSADGPATPSGPPVQTRPASAQPDSTHAASARSAPAADRSARPQVATPEPQPAASTAQAESPAPSTATAAPKPGPEAPAAEPDAPATADARTSPAEAEPQGAGDGEVASAAAPAPAPERAAPPAARMPDPFEFVRKEPPKPKVIEVGTATVNPPRLIAESRVNPKVPLAAQRLGVSGVVVLKATVGPDGTVTDVEIVSEPNRKAGLGKAAADAVRRWRYEPATMNGDPVESPVEVRINFAN